MDLTRLRSIVRGGGSAGAASPVPRRRELTYEPVGPDGLPIDVRAEVPSLQGAGWLQTDLGPVVVIDHEYPPEFLHGRVAVEDLAGWDPVVLARVNGRPLDRAPAAGEEDEAAPGDGSGEVRPVARDAFVRPIEREECIERARFRRAGGVPVFADEQTRSPLFFDLETTGLSGGAGTVPFLVGCGYFEAGSFRTRQFFLHGFAAERALLQAVTQFLAGVPLLVTYNGRTFDVPVMETRWLFHRMRVALEDMPHLDMLPPSRRLWRLAPDNEERSCRLVSLETLLCGVVRVGDVPGAEIPQRYFEYVRHGDARLLEPVLYHNRMDLLSLAALTARAQRLICGGAIATADAAECLSLGRLLDTRGERGEAERCYRRVAADPMATHEQREDARHALARLLRRARRFQEAAVVWRELLANGVGRSPAVREAIEALAVHHEHRERDLERARALAVRALGMEREPDRREAVSYRLARLDRKLSSAPGHAPRQPTLIAPDSAGN